jgi:anti-sigma-K factor RskA
MLNAMIQAYSLGCLNPEEVRQIRKFGKNDAEFNLKDLGKYQNLTALLPSALSTEIPDSSVKDKIARKLYRMKDDTTSRKEAIQNYPESRIINQTSEKKSALSGESLPLTGDLKKSRELEELKVSVSPIHRSFKVSTIAILSGSALIVGLFLGYLLFFESKDALQNEVISYQEQLHDLNSELIMHNGLLTLLEKRDLRILHLSGSEMYPDVFGKIYVHNSSNRAYIYLSGIPVLKGESIYQLWIINGSNIHPAGSFNPKSNSDYYFFTFPRIDINRNTRILLTEEPLGGSKKPGRKVFLTNQY